MEMVYRYIQDLFRVAIYEQITAAKENWYEQHENGVVTCWRTHFPIPRELCDADHGDKKSFTRLVYAYLVERPYVITKIMNPRCQPLILADWQEFHKMHADLKPCYRLANQKAAKERVPWFAIELGTAREMLNPDDFLTPRAL